MEGLEQLIRQAVIEGRWLLSDHAREVLEERRIPAWQVEGGIHGAVLLKELPNSTPNPKIEMDQLLPDGTAIKVVWAYRQSPGLAILVTAHFYDR